jgi:hypothetical protein
MHPTTTQNNPRRVAVSNPYCGSAALCGLRYDGDEQKRFGSFEITKQNYPRPTSHLTGGWSGVGKFAARTVLRFKKQWLFRENSTVPPQSPEHCCVLLHSNS